MVTCGGDASAWTRASLTEDQGFERRGGRPNVDDLQTPEPVVCEQRDGPTPSHPEPGRETSQRRRYWRDARWETRSVHPPTRRGAVAARRAHNPKVGGSNPPAATTRTDTPSSAGMPAGRGYRHFGALQHDSDGRMRDAGRGTPGRASIFDLRHGRHDLHGWCMAAGSCACGALTPRASVHRWRGTAGEHCEPGVLARRCRRASCGAVGRGCVARDWCCRPA